MDNKSGTSKYVDIMIEENLKLPFSENIVLYQLMELITAKLQTTINYNSQEVDKLIVNVYKKTGFISWQLKSNAKEIGIDVLKDIERIIFTKNNRYLTLEECVRYLLDLEGIQHQYNCFMQTVNRTVSNNNRKEFREKNTTKKIEKIPEEHWNYIHQNYHYAFESSPENAGFTKDVGEYILNGAFWNSGKVLRHVLGKDNVYDTYAYSIIENGGKEYKLQQAKEACDYAIKNEDYPQIVRFLLYAFEINKVPDKQWTMAYRCAEYYTLRNMDFPMWFIPYAYQVGCFAYIYGKERQNTKANRLIICHCVDLCSRYEGFEEKTLCLKGLYCELTNRTEEIQKYYYEVQNIVNINTVNKLWEKIKCPIRI